MENILVVQSNLATSYQRLGRTEDALRTQRGVYSGTLKLHGEETRETLREANNYADSLTRSERFEEARSLLRKMIPVARRVLGENHDLTLKMRWIYMRAFYEDNCATLDDLREAVKSLEDMTRTARRVLGGAHPVTSAIEDALRMSREVLCARENGKKVTFVKH